MNRRGQSDGPVVPANPPNKAAAAEAGEERGPAKGNTASKTRPGRSAGSGVSSALDRVRQVAVRDKEAQFTALLRHVDLERRHAGGQDCPCATRARGRGCDAGRRPLTDCAAVWEMKDWWPFGVALRGVASNRLMLH